MTPAVSTNRSALFSTTSPPEVSATGEIPPRFALMRKVAIKAYTICSKCSTGSPLEEKDGIPCLHMICGFPWWCVTLAEVRKMADATGISTKSMTNEMISADVKDDTFLDEEELAVALDAPYPPKQGSPPYIFVAFDPAGRGRSKYVGMAIAPDSSMMFHVLGACETEYNAIDPHTCSHATVNFIARIVERAPPQTKIIVTYETNMNHPAHAALAVARDWRKAHPELHSRVSLLNVDPTREGAITTTESSKRWGARILGIYVNGASELRPGGGACFRVSSDAIYRRYPPGDTTGTDLPPEMLCRRLFKEMASFRPKGSNGPDDTVMATIVALCAAYMQTEYDNAAAAKRPYIPPSYKNPDFPIHSFQWTRT